MHLSSSPWPRPRRLSPWPVRPIRSIVGQPVVFTVTISSWAARRNRYRPVRRQRVPDRQRRRLGRASQLRDRVTDPGHSSDHGRLRGGRRLRRQLLGEHRRADGQCGADVDRRDQHPRPWPRRTGPDADDRRVVVAHYDLRPERHPDGHRDADGHGVGVGHSERDGHLLRLSRRIRSPPCRSPPLAARPPPSSISPASWGASTPSPRPTTGTTTFGSSSSTAPVNLSVAEAPTIVTVASSADPTVLGQAVVFSVSISSSASGRDRHRSVRRQRNHDRQRRRLRWASHVPDRRHSTLGAHPITAVYEGDDDFVGSSSTNTVTQTVDQASTSTDLTSSHDPGLVGQTVDLHRDRRRRCARIRVADAAACRSATAGARSPPARASRSRRAAPLEATCSQVYDTTAGAQRHGHLQR